MMPRWFPIMGSASCVIWCVQTCLAHFLVSFFKDFFLLVYMHMSAGSQGGQKVWNPLELKLQEVVGATWVLKTQVLYKSSKYSLPQ